MNKKLQVFVSSTYTDLIEERQAAVEAILDAGHIPAGMELFKAGKSQMKTIRKWIDESDVYMLILGGRYGSIDEESGLSYTELEYQYALSKNMPVFAIVLEDSFLLAKAASKGKDMIFEKDNTEKYDAFKNYVMNKIVKKAQNVSQIASAIYAQLNSINNDSDYSLTGWVKSDSIINNYDTMDKQLLLQNNANIIKTILKSKCPINLDYQISDFAVSFSDELDIILNNSDCILNSSERQIRLELVPNTKNTLKVTITKILDYLYLNNKEHAFDIKFNATEQQANTYTIHSLFINNDDYTSNLNISISKNANRGQFIYNVESNKVAVPTDNCKIIYAASYECPALDFFQSHRINCLCKQFKATILLDESLKQKYTLVCSTFSPFSKVFYDDYKAGEMIKPYDEQIILPNWSLPGSGYIATLKLKSINNHI